MPVGIGPASAAESPEGLEEPLDVARRDHGAGVADSQQRGAGVDPGTDRGTTCAPSTVGLRAALLAPAEGLAPATVS